MNGAADHQLAIFCDYENVAIGAADASCSAFDIRRVMAVLEPRGELIVKRAYSDWTRYARHRRALHQAGFALIEVPHLSLSGKNSADIRLVVDALDLSYTRPHIDTFVIISGDSDFSPLVSKLKERGRAVIGVGVRDSTSSLLASACDEFLYYDTFSRPQLTTSAAARPASAPASSPEEALTLVAETAEDLLSGRDKPVWGSHIKQVIKRKQPRFSERKYGFGSFSELLRAASRRAMLQIRHDERSGGYLVTDTP